MNNKRVVVTGMSGITALGNDWGEIHRKMTQGKTAVQVMPEWKAIDGLNTRLAAPVVDFELPSHYTRKQTRAMGRVAGFAVVSAEAALKQAKLYGQEALFHQGRVGIAYGSCSGSTRPLADLTAIYTEKTVKHITATTYIKSMSHTCAVNVALFFGITGRIIPTSSACTSGSQAIGYAYEAIKHGYQDIMIAGGAEELCVSQVAVFDTLYATSQKNQTPEKTPRPFDQDRDGLVIGEGAGTLILEELSHALARGATIYAEIIGFGTNCDAEHITQPSADLMQRSLGLALEEAGIEADKIGYISAHGTATERGDIAESHATYQTFHRAVPISSLKGYFGHTLGACGAIEAWLSIEMLNKNKFVPTIHLETVDPRCAPLDYIKQQDRLIETNYIMSNNFAFGGINTSLIFKKLK